MDLLHRAQRPSPRVGPSFFFFYPHVLDKHNVHTASGSTTANLMNSIYGWISSKRTSYASSFHVYAMEWTDSWMRFYTDNRLQAMIDISSISSKGTDSYFWDVGKFPSVAMNMSSGKYIVVEDPWSTTYGGSAAAPFDQCASDFSSRVVVDTETERARVRQLFTLSLISRLEARTGGSRTTSARSHGWTALHVSVKVVWRCDADMVRVRCHAGFRIRTGYVECNVAVQCR